MDRQSEPADPTGVPGEQSPLAPASGLDGPTEVLGGPVATALDDRPYAGLTRVAIDPERLVDEQSAAWVRHEVRRMVAWQLVVTFAIVFAILVPVLWISLGDPVLSVLISVVGAGLITAARLGFALAAAPLGYRYVQRFSAAPPEYLLAHSSIAEPGAPGPLTPPSLPPPVSAPLPELPPPAPPAPPADVWDLDPEPLGAESTPAIGLPDPASAITTEMSTMPAPSTSSMLPELSSGPLVDLDGTPVPERHTATADVLRELGFAPVATLRTEGLGGRYIDLYGDRDRVVVAVDRTSATTTVLTELAGFRVLVTSALLMPPTDELVVNVVADGDPAGLVLSHQRLVQQAFRSRTRVSEPVGLFKLAQQRELEAYRELGPLWGAVLDLRCRSRGVRLLAAPSAGDVLLFTGNRLFQQTSRERAS